jgi:glycosyltransferase involved in cell wall biosynthesis
MLSFIIPTLNEEKTIENTLKSINSFVGDKEIIISDGKSRDKTIEIAKKYTDKIIVHDGLTRQNIAQGRNAGARESIGEYIIFIDADVIIPDINGFIKKAEGYFKSDKNLVAITAGCVVLKDVANIWDIIIFKILAWYFSFLNYIGFGAAGGEFQMIKRDAFLKVKGFDEDIAVSEDMDLFWRLAKIGKTKLPLGFNVYHTGRRAHKIGWPRLLWQWISNTITVFFFKRSDGEWKEIR